MFVSLNKKIIYTISLFFLLTSLIFIYTFYIVYGNKIQEEQESNIKRNQQYIQLLMENISISKELQAIIIKNKNIHIDPNVRHKLMADSSEKQINELSREQQRIKEMGRDYDERYNSIQEGIKIVILSTLLITLSIVLLWALIRRWIIVPIDKLTQVSNLVSKGRLSIRVKVEKSPLFEDELNTLTITFNQMLDNLQNVIAEVKNKEAFMQSLIDSIPDGIRVIDKDYNIIISNQAYEKQIGSSKPSKCQKCYAASQHISSPCPENLFTCPIREIILNNKNNIKVIQQFKNHPNQHLAINAAPLYISNNEKYVVESIRDLSEDIDFSHQQKLSSIGFLATSVAHEMKNNLGAIRIIMEHLLDKFHSDAEDTSEEKKHLLMIYKQLVESINVPERLLKLAQTDNDDQDVINCCDAITDVISLLDFEAKSKGSIIELKCDSPSLTLKGSAADFKMVITNLILNALRAMHQNGHLQIELSMKNNEIDIKVIDNGIGIEKDKIHRIFEPFYSDRQNATNKGTGLGLAIVKSIIEKFNGKISVKSTPNVGTIFTIKLPLTK